MRDRVVSVGLLFAATAFAVAVFMSRPAGAPVRPVVPNVAALLGPSVLASAKPAPDLNLALPDDIAMVVRRSGINGETGLIPTAASITTFRLRATGDLISVAAPTGVEPVRRTASDDIPAITVRGAYAIVSTDHGNTVIRWTENGVTYEVSSRTLDVAGLAEVANRLR